MIPLWHDGPLAALAPGEAPLVWSVPDEGADARAAAASALVARRAGVDGVTLARSAAGAPRVAHPAGWYLSLTRRGGIALIAVATQPIAVDREVADDATPLWDMLAPTEAAMLGALAVGDRPRTWLRLWTIKEAHAKLIGEPRRLAPEAIVTRLIDATRATATWEGRSLCWTRTTGAAIETVAMWEEPR